MAEVRVLEGHGPTVAQKEVEIVERKGKGHPDSLCDEAAETLSVALSSWYKDHYGKILHHNVDKAVLVGGSTTVHFGGGQFHKKIKVIVAGRATLTDDLRDPEEVLVPIVRERLQSQIRHLRDEHLDIYLEVRPGAADLQAIFQDEDRPPPANDTSLAVGFAPLTPLEKITLETESFLNSEEVKRLMGPLGEDIKVMGVRKDDQIRLTIAAAFLASLVPDRQTYDRLKEQVVQLVKERVVSRFWSGQVEVYVNTADTRESVYLTLTGTSAESGDDGQVGRGNRACGLITPFRPMSLEAIAGKNPVNHVGKVYSIMSRLIAEKVVEQFPEVRQVYCYMVSQIGRPINDPEAVAVEVWGVSPSAVKNSVETIVESVLDDWKEIRQGFLDRKWRIF